jgi:hypothetical protein
MTGSHVSPSHALPDLFAVAILVVSLVAVIVYRLGTVRLMITGSMLGALLTRQGRQKPNVPRCRE